MASSHLLNLESIDLRYTYYVGYIIIAFISIHLFSIFSLDIQKTYPGFPSFNGKGKGEWIHHKAHTRFEKEGIQMIKDAVEKFKGSQIFQIFIETGPRLIIPISKFEEIRNDKRLSFLKANASDHFHQYPGFHSNGPDISNDIFLEVVRVKLTQSLAQTVEPLNLETAAALETYMPPTTEWEKCNFVKSSMPAVTQVTSRIFLGDVPICRDPRWLSVALSYTIYLTDAVLAMRKLPAFARPVLHWFLPEARALRKAVQIGRDLLEPEIKRREKARKEAAARGETLPKSVNALDWYDEVAKAKGRKYDIVLGQLQLSFAAIHTTSMTLGHVMFDLIANPEYIKLLREEIITVFKETGWSREFMVRLKLMDSCLKESQRINVLGPVLLNRYANEPITLSDGTTIPKDGRFMVPTTHHMDPSLYPDPSKFNGHRYFALRQEPGEENKHQFVTLNQNQIGFGHGSHACPGRFFASNELKTLLVHLLMKYDWEFEDGKRPVNVEHGLTMTPNPEAVVLRRSRKSEIEL